MRKAPAIVLAHSTAGEVGEHRMFVNLVHLRSLALNTGLVGCKPGPVDTLESVELVVAVGDSMVGVLGSALGSSGHRSDWTLSVAAEVGCIAAAVGMIGMFADRLAGLPVVVGFLGAAVAALARAAGTVGAAGIVGAAGAAVAAVAGIGAVRIVCSVDGTQVVEVADMPRKDWRTVG